MIKDVGYNVLSREYVGDEETTRETRIIRCSSLEDFKKKMQDMVTRSYNAGNDHWKLEAPQIFSDAFEEPHSGVNDTEILHWAEFCDKEPLLIWKERVVDFSRWNKLKRGEL